MQDEFEQQVNDTDDECIAVSKSQVKREMQAIVELAEKLLAFSQEKIAACGISEKSLRALQEARPMKASSAKKRQLKYVAKLLRNEDTHVLQALVDQTEASQQAENRKFHELERWRDRLIEEGDAAIEPLLVVVPGIDRQHVRQLIRVAQKELQQEKPPAAARKLFKYLRESGNV